MALVAELEVFLATGNICPVDLTALYHRCGSVVLNVGEYVHKIDVQPQTIYVTPTHPTSTTSCTSERAPPTVLPAPPKISTPVVLNALKSVDKTLSVLNLLPSSSKTAGLFVASSSSAKTLRTPALFATFSSTASKPSNPVNPFHGPKPPFSKPPAGKPPAWKPPVGLSETPGITTKAGQTGTVTATPIRLHNPPVDAVEKTPSTTKTGLTGSVPAIPINLPNPPAGAGNDKVATTKTALRLANEPSASVPSVPTLAPPAPPAPVAPLPTPSAPVVPAVAPPPPAAPPAPFVPSGPPVVHVTPGSTCKSGGFLSIVIDLTTLNIDVDLYLSLCGILDSVGDLVSGLLHGSSSKPTSLTREYRTHCGESFAKYPGGLTTTAKDNKDCLIRCERHAIQQSVGVDTLCDCLGASFQNELADGNCLYWIGSDSDMLDANPSIITYDSHVDSYCK